VTIAASAFPRLSPSGLRVVAGEKVIVVDQSIEVGPGAAAQWASETAIYYTRQPDGAFMVWDGRSAIVRQPGFNTFSVGGPGRWAGYNAEDGVTFDSGTHMPDWSSPALSEDPSVWAAVVHNTGRLLTGIGTPARYASGNCNNLRFCGRALAWNVFVDGRWQIAGVRDLLKVPTETPALLNIAREEFWPVPLLVNGELWLLTHTHDRLLLRPWGSHEGYVVATGNTSHPDVKQRPDGRIRIVWDALHDRLGEALIDPTTARQDLTAPPVEPPMPGDKMKAPGVTIDHFDPTLRPGQPWKVEFHDRHNDMTARVELVNGSVHVLIKNSQGEDRSGARRPVEVRCEGGPVVEPPPPVDPPPPPPPPTSDLDRIDGQLQIESGGGFVVNGRPVLPILCHFGDALSRWARGQQGAVAADLDDIAAAGYHGIRFWSTIGGDSDFWRGRGVGPVETPDYWSHVQAFLEALRDRGLVCQLSQGDVRNNVIPDRRSFALEMADRVNAVGPHVVALFEAANESRDTGEPDARRLAEFAQWFHERCPAPLCALSSFTGTEDVAILNDFSRAPAHVFVCHGYRGGRWWDKTRHIFSLVYEGKPSKRLGWQGEPAGPGALVSAIDHKGELDADALCAMAAQSLLTRQAWVYFSGPGVKSDDGERLQGMPGFHEVPRVRTLLPADVMRYDEVFHGGDSWARQRIFAAQGEVRADHAYYRDGRFVCLVYGPGSLDVPQTRAARIDRDHRFGDKARLIVGQAQ
jgi:hypothetical protein